MWILISTPKVIEIRFFDCSHFSRQSKHVSKIKHSTITNFPFVCTLRSTKHTSESIFLPRHRRQPNKPSVKMQLSAFNTKRKLKRPLVDVTAEIESFWPDALQFLREWPHHSPAPHIFLCSPIEYCINSSVTQNWTGLDPWYLGNSL
jgi:hypothetical protein